MKIKLKIKTILLVLLSMILVFTVVAPIVTYGVANILDSKGSEKAEIFYKANLSYPIKFKEDKSLYEIATNLIGEFPKFTLFNHMSGTSGDFTPEDMEESKEALEKILYNFEKSEYFLPAYSLIMDLSIANQDVEGLLDWIDWGKNHDREDLIYFSDIYKAYYLFTNRDYDEANNILDKYKGKQVDYRYYFLQGNIYAFQGKEELAQECFAKIMENTERGSVLFGSPLAYRRSHWYSDYLSELKGNYKIKGKVSYNGQPMPFVEVYAQREISGMMFYNDLIGITDINGEFETLGLNSGRYEIGIGLNPATLYDKVYLKENINSLEVNKDTEFNFNFTSPMKIISPESKIIVKDSKFTLSWEPVEGASYYQIETMSFYEKEGMSGGIGYTIGADNGNSNIRSTSIEMEIDKLRKLVFATSYDGEGDNLKARPFTILGTFFPGNDYPIIVNAFDNKGNIVTSSSSLIKFYDELPSVRIEGEVSTGENYILKGDYEEAIKHYEEILDRDPNNEEALIYLSKIYGFGWTNRPEYEEKAIAYANRYLESYDDGSIFLMVIRYMGNESKEKYIDLIEEAMDKIPLNDRMSDYYYELGQIKTITGDYQEARDALELGENYLPMEAFYMDLYLGDIDKAIAGLGDNRLNIYRMNKETLKSSLLDLNEEILQSDDYKIFKDFLDNLISGNLSEGEKRELLSKSAASIENKSIKNLIYEIRLEEYLDEN